MTKQSEKKQKRLMEKSEELFWKYGYNAVSIDQIAAEVGISKMTIYKHFNSKEDLFIEVLKINIDYHMNKVMELISEKDHTVDKIEVMYNYSLGITKEYPNILLRDIVERKSILEKVTAIKLERGLPIWQYILKDGISKKEIREMDFDFVSELLMNLPTAIKNLDFMKDKNNMIKFYTSFMDFIKYGLLGGMENQQREARKEGVDDAEKHTDES